MSHRWAVVFALLVVAGGGAYGTCTRSDRQLETIRPEPIEPGVQCERREVVP